MHKDKTRRGRRGLALRIRLGLGVVLGLGVGVLVYKTYDPSPVGHFRTEKGHRAYAASYAAAMEQLPTLTRSMDLETDFGTVRVYEFASARTRRSVPVVLLPGRTSGAPMWEANLSGLAEERTVYALDALGDAGMSVQTRKIEDSADQAVWLDQVLAQLGSPKVHLVGHSFGGWTAANYALRHPERVASLMLLEPVFVFGGAEEIDPNDPVTRMISDATEHYAAKLPLPQRLSKSNSEIYLCPSTSRWPQIVPCTTRPPPYGSPTTTSETSGSGTGRRPRTRYRWSSPTN
jgi:pimeloyl-ACP methyl ester carboxylesterase